MQQLANKLMLVKSCYLNYRLQSPQFPSSPSSLGSRLGFQTARAGQELVAVPQACFDGFWPIILDNVLQLEFVLFLAH